MSDNALGGLSPAQDKPFSIERQWVRIRRYREILADFARLAPETTSVERLSQLACIQAVRGIGIGHSKALRHRPEVGDLLLVAGVGWDQGVVGDAALGTDLATPAGRTFQTRQTVILYDAPNDPEFRYDSLLRDHGIVSLLNAPSA